MKVAIEVGHGGRDSGAVGRDGTAEKDIALKVALLAKKVLEHNGIGTVMSRTGDTFSDFSTISRRGAQNGCDTLISIHCNGSANSSANGFEIYCNTRRPDSVRLANTCNDVWKTEPNMYRRNMGVKDHTQTWVGSLAVCTGDIQACILLELGFMSNDQDLAMMKSQSYQEKAAKCITQTLLKYYGRGGGLKMPSDMSVSGSSGPRKVRMTHVDNVDILTQIPNTSVEQMKAYSMKKNAPDLANLCELIYKVSRKVGVNTCVLYAQVVLETAWLKYGGVIDKTYKNTCGLKTKDGGGDYDPNAHQRFNTWEDGLTAHADHLALYAGKAGYPKSDSLDPRQQVAARYHGSTPKVLDFNGAGWATRNGTYGTLMLKTINELIKVEEGAVDTILDGDGDYDGMSSDAGELGASSDGSFRITKNGNDVLLEKEPIGKTMVEPVYPDMVDVTFKYPDLNYIEKRLRELNVDKEQFMKDNQNMVFSSLDLANLGINVKSTSFDYNNLLKREDLFDSVEYADVKKFESEGTLQNFDDPYPIDEKRQELEEHEPFAKIHHIILKDADDKSMQIAAELIDLSDKTEKRFTQLENIVSTLLGDFHRIGSRMHVNCVYWGGTDANRKYEAIRCMNHDRIDDGGLVTLEQCVKCTRYEPIYGQTYDILDNTGASLNAILDDNQMSYSTIEEYSDFARLEKYCKPAPKKTVELDDLKFRKPGETKEDFINKLETAQPMDWELQVAEEQNYDVKYENGEFEVILPSNYKRAGFKYGLNSSNSSAAPGSTDSAKVAGDLGFKATDEFKKMIDKNQKAIDGTSNVPFKTASDNAKTWANSANPTTLKKSKDNEWLSKLPSLADSYDPVMVYSIIAADSEGDPLKTEGIMKRDGDVESSMTDDQVKLSEEGIKKGMERLKKTRSSVGTSNIAILIPAFHSLQVVLDYIKDKNINKDTITYDKVYSDLSSQSDDFKNYYLKFHHVAKSVIDSESNSAKLKPGSSGGRIFVFDENVLATKNIKLTSKFGMRNGAYHYGIDLAGNPGEQGYPITAPLDGKVVHVGSNSGGTGNWIVLSHADNYFTVYMHLMEVPPFKIGDEVSQGKHIGKVGNTGDSYGPHLHFEVRRGTGHFDKAEKLDPVKEWYPFLEGFIQNSKIIRASDVR